ncbi:MAG: DoxX family membrane protein [Acidimicrobiia bacterium]|nr:DoxX family membrane protein [Acidimicrobiia bacterium]MDH5504203.1 DoxX family membrane protein [Acidimicrobiia bacterium]
MTDTIRTLFDSLLDYPDLPLLLVRLVVGLVFVVAVRNKLNDVPAFAEHNGLSVPVAWGLVFAEAAGGIGFILGILPQLAAMVIMASMIGSMSFHIFKWKSKYWAASGGWEYDLMIFTMASVILVNGGGTIVVWPSI